MFLAVVEAKALNRQQHQAKKKGELRFPSVYQARQYNHYIYRLHGDIFVSVSPLNKTGLQRNKHY